MSGRAKVRRTARAPLWEANQALIHPQRIALRLCTLRKRAGLTQAQVGEASGIGHKTLITRAESGTHDLTLDTIARICSACDASIMDVFVDLGAP